MKFYLFFRLWQVTCCIFIFEIDFVTMMSPWPKYKFTCLNIEWKIRDVDNASGLCNRWEIITDGSVVPNNWSEILQSVKMEIFWHTGKYFFQNQFQEKHFGIPYTIIPIYKDHTLTLRKYVFHRQVTFVWRFFLIWTIDQVNLKTVFLVDNYFLLLLFTL